jgi:glutathione S-transferase
MHDQTTASSRVWSGKTCGWALRNYAALIEKSVDFLLVPARNPDGEKKLEFLALSPSHTTPLLQQGSVVVWESKIINEYIDEAFTGKPLMPANLALRAKLRNLNYYCDQVLMPLFSRIVRNDDPAQALTELRARIVEFEAYAFAEGWAGPYWNDADYSLVDICYLNFFDNLDYLNRASITEPMVLTQRLQDWQTAIEARPSTIRARAIMREFAKNETETLVRS